MDSLEGLPPIEVYQIGDVYFVRDGNHRVSVARQREATHIEAYVTPVVTSIPLSADDPPDDLIRKARYAHFLETTRLDTTIPDIDLTMTVAGNYRILEAQIREYQHLLKQNYDEQLSYPEAAQRWYVAVYWPLIQLIRQRGILRDFPQRTETDLYVWIDKHRQELAEELGWSVAPATAVIDFADQQATSPKKVMHRMSEKLRHALTPDLLESGPAVGALAGILVGHPAGGSII